MKKPFNLYYILLEDMKNNLLSKEKIERTKAIIDDFFARTKKTKKYIPEKISEK